MEDDKKTPYEQAAENERQADLANRAANKSKEPQVAMPFGRRVPAGKFLAMAPFFKDAGKALHSPEELLKNPELDKYKYAWPDSESVECQARVNAGVYIPVKKTELKADAEIATHKGTDTNVYWYRHMLVKIPLKYAEEIYEWPKAWAASRLAKQEEWYMNEVERASGGLAEASIQKQVTREPIAR
jgi:hypothetical protein